MSWFAFGMTAQKLHFNFCSSPHAQFLVQTGNGATELKPSVSLCIWLFIVILLFNLQLVFTDAPNILTWEIKTR
jgi:hypothetical protein